MTNILFGQWRDDKLPNGDYYIKVLGNLTGKEFFARDNYINGKWKYTLDRNVVDIIAPVPSYNEYIKLVSKTEQLQEANEVIKHYAEKNGYHKAMDYLNKWGVK